ncbi:MAG: hypothetical protein N5P05_001881 [Chroococcopsis gigantea SAG 12.99]|jgi:nucleotide-binding universal stress UspA family protein|nr:universal stress protein [Chlorogloea purpurea SAG 13.99]MDV3000275.1 hypothetical protein [Chroococcopsis gigantea SAG 12.99]
MFERGLICTDFKDGLYRLAQFVPQLEACGFKELTFLHCIPAWQQKSSTGIDRSALEQAKNKLSKGLEISPSEIDVKIEISSARPRDAIDHLINDRHIEIIFLGNSARNALDEKLFGSVSADLAPHLSIPLMFIRPQLISVYTEEELSLRSQHLFRSLLIPYNGNEESKILVESLKVIAKNNSQTSLKQCVLLWVVEDISRDESVRQSRLNEARQTLDKVKNDLETLELEVFTDIRQGDYYLETVEAGINYNISAIASLNPAQQNWLEMVVSNRAKEFVKQCWFPLLFFPHKK